MLLGNKCQIHKDESILEILLVDEFAHVGHDTKDHYEGKKGILVKEAHYCQKEENGEDVDDLERTTNALYVVLLYFEKLPSFLPLPLLPLKTDHFGVHKLTL